MSHFRGCLGIRPSPILCTSMAIVDKCKDLAEQIARYEQLLSAWRNVQSEASADPSPQGQMRLKSSSDIIAALERSHQSARERLALIQDHHAADSSR